MKWALLSSSVIFVILVENRGRIAEVVHVWEREEDWVTPVIHAERGNPGWSISGIKWSSSPEVVNQWYIKAKTTGKPGWIKACWEGRPEGVLLARPKGKERGMVVYLLVMTRGVSFLRDYIMGAQNLVHSLSLCAFRLTPRTNWQADNYWCCFINHGSVKG